MDMQYKIVMVDINKLEDAEYNPRNITHTMLEKLKKGLQEFGCVQPIVANDATATRKGQYTVVGGHQRLKAAKELGWKEVPCQIIHEPDVKREKALNLALNKVSGEWNFDKLGEVLADLDDGGFDIELSGFDSIEVKELEGIDESLSSGAFASFDRPRTADSPQEFPGFDEGVKTDYCCPKCRYEWSGKPK